MAMKNIEKTYCECFRRTSSRTYYWACVLCAALVMMTSCSEEEPPVETPHDLAMSEAYILDSTVYADQGMTAYNFAYPSVDPDGHPIMLSGTITLGDDARRGTTAKGLLLYNHFTVYRADQCPSRGDLSMQQKMLGFGLIAVSPDYYGFGVTGHHHQAYCLSLYNARTSLDALQAAKSLLTQLGYRWDNRLFNAGYSQGAQTALALVRLVAEEHPELDITYTFAGAGPYDLRTTYLQFTRTHAAGMPSTVVSALLAYNEFKHLGAEHAQLFREPLLSHINDWFFSKRYTSQEIDDLVGSTLITDYLTPALTDTTSTLATTFLNAFDSDNLCHGWTPRGNEHILLFHSTQDITVPPINTQKMYDFLTSHGVQDVQLELRDIAASGDTPAHENAAQTYGLVSFMKLIKILSGN